MTKRTGGQIGGAKDSGFGSEGGKEGLETYQVEGDPSGMSVPQDLTAPQY